MNGLKVKVKAGAEVGQVGKIIGFTTLVNGGVIFKIELENGKTVTKNTFQIEAVE